MKRLISVALFLCLASFGFGQVSDVAGSAVLTSTCSNANTTCDAAGTTNFNSNSAFTVLGPQTIEVNTQNYGLAQITFSGTYSGSTVNFEFSDDGGTTWYATTCTRSDTNLQETSEAIATNAYRAIECSVGAGTKFRVRQSAITSGGPRVVISLTSGLLEPAPTVQLSSAGTTGANPCANPHSSLTTTTVSMSTTSLTQFIALSGTTKIYPCSILISNSSATATVAIKTGTGSNCGTGTATFYDAFTMPASTAAPLVINGNLGAMPAGAAACYVLTGTTPTATMTFSYVQQ